MGCSESVPEVVLPDPSGPSVFKVKPKGTFSDDFKVYDSEGRYWLLLDNSGCGRTGTGSGKLLLENFHRVDGSKHGECLASAQVEVDTKLKGKLEIEEDSDPDDSEEETEFEFKRKWTVKRKIAIKNRAGEEVAKVTSTIKGKSKAEVTKTEGEENLHPETTSSVKSKIKKVETALTVHGAEVLLETSPEGDFKDWDRKWDCALFTTNFDKQSQTTVTTKYITDPGVGLVTAFAVSNFCNPYLTMQLMEQQTLSRAQHEARAH